MFRKTLAFMTAITAAACMFASCGDSGRDKDDDDDTTVSSTYISKSKKTAANVTASNIYKGVNSALADFREKGADYRGKYIICSDAQKNVLLPDGGEAIEPEEFMKYVGDNYMELKDLEYIVIISDGACEAVAAAMDGGKYVGLYPQDTIVDIDSFKDTIKTYEPDEKIDMTEVYDIYKSQVN